MSKNKKIRLLKNIRENDKYPVKSITLEEVTKNSKMKAGLHITAIFESAEYRERIKKEFE